MQEDVSKEAEEEWPEKEGPQERVSLLLSTTIHLGR